LDNFFNELNSDPNAQGMIVVYSEFGEPRSGQKRRRQLENQSDQMDIDDDEAAGTCVHLA